MSMMELRATKFYEESVKSDPEDSEYTDEDEDNLSVMYDNDNFPFWYKRRDGSMYTNKAWKDREAQILDYEKRSSELSVYDAIHCPPGCAGGIVPLDLSHEDVLPTLKTLCNAALKIYNQNNIKQGPTFVFHKVVKCTHPGATALRNLPAMDMLVLVALERLLGVVS